MTAGFEMTTLFNRLSEVPSFGGLTRGLAEDTCVSLLQCKGGEFSWLATCRFFVGLLDIFAVALEKLFSSGKTKEASGLTFLCVKETFVATAQRKNRNFAKFESFAFTAAVSVREARCKRLSCSNKARLLRLSRYRRSASSSLIAASARKDAI